MQKSTVYTCIEERRKKKEERRKKKEERRKKKEERRSKTTGTKKAP
ncbi:hypothetical protein [Vibrio sp. 10N.286.54.B2]